MPYPFTLPALPYAYDALEPYIDARTMEIHHTKHHQAYIDNLNKALAHHPELHHLEVAELIAHIDKLPADIATAVRNNGGGHYNHSLFWQMMATGKATQVPQELSMLINRDVGSLQNVQSQMSAAALARFGSGWAWLSLNPEDRLVITSTPNQDSPVQEGLRPILGLDVWEHAYYLKYQNKRADYIQAWWHVVNWDYVYQLYESVR